MKKVLYVFPIRTTFVQSDLEILSRHFHVIPFHFDTTRKAWTPVYFIRQFFFLLFHAGGSTFYFSQFSGYHSFLPAVFGKMLRKKSFIVLHGTECNNFPEYHYGYLRKPVLNWFNRKSLAWSGMLFPVSQSLVSTEYTFAETTYKKQGYLSFYPGIRTPYVVIPNGVVTTQFDLLPDSNRIAASFITVATGIESANRRAIKGVDLVIALARLTPDYTYTIIGAAPESLPDLPDNITALPRQPHEALERHYNHHAFYLQVSASEGFGISVCEAMLCGCVPIVSKVGALPEIAGPYGYVLEHQNVDQLRQLVESAVHNYSAQLQTEVRHHIIDHYSMFYREKNLLESIK
ncbi:MAG TPA: glycosyltransferase family 4 protein [Saprospiraceae bacterium]|nr:glycosyltransferase family 4 protein [Saprospiraceae bacterium]